MPPRRDRVRRLLEIYPVGKEKEEEEEERLPGELSAAAVAAHENDNRELGGRKTIPGQGTRVG